jgi:hypothetical protein
MARLRKGGVLMGRERRSKFAIDAKTTADIASQLAQKANQDDFEDVVNQLSFFNGKINKSSSIPTTFNQFYKALKANRTIKIVVIGDSISTAGSHVLGTTYKAAGGFWVSSPDGLTRTDTYFSRLIDLFTNKFQDRTFDFYNYAVGGSIIQQWQDSKTFDGTTKPWIDFVKDAQPDLVIIGWGMNTSIYTTTREYKQYLDKVITYINGFTVKPSIALVTTPRPVLAVNDYWGNDENQNSRSNAAYVTRNFGYEKGCYVIDVNRLSDIKRNGEDKESLEMAEITPTIITGGVLANGEYTLASGQELIITDKLQDFIIEFDINMQALSTGDNIWLRYNRFANESVDLHNATLLFPEQATGKGAIASYGNWVNSAYYPEATGSVGVAYSLKAYEYVNIRLEKRGAEFNVYVFDTRILRDYISSWGVSGSISFQHFNSNTIKVKNIKVYKGKPKPYYKTMTEEDMWGNYIKDNFGTKPIRGGNGVNHPSTVGLNEVYVPAIKEFVDDIANFSFMKDIIA